MKKIGLLSLFLLASTALAACGTVSTRSLTKETKGEVEEQQEEQSQPFGMSMGGDPEVQTYIDEAQEQKRYDEGQILKREFEPIQFEPQTTEDDRGYEIIVKHQEKKSLTSGNASITNLLANDQIFPGLLLIPDGELMSASPTKLQIARGLMPFSIVLDGAGMKDPSFDVVPDSRSAVRTEVQNRLYKWKDDYSRTAQMQSDLEQVFSREQVETRFGIGVADSLNISKTETTTATSNTFIATFTDVFYSVGVEMTKEGKIFDKSVHKADLANKIEREGKYYPPLLVTNCKYGRTIYFKIETELNKEQVKNGLEYAGSVDVEKQKKFNETFKNSSISCMVYGGSQRKLEQWFAEDDFASKIASIFSSASEVKEDIVNAALLSYSCNFIDHNMKFAGVYSATDYIETTYTTLKEQELQIHNNAWYTVEYYNIYGAKLKGWTKEGKPIFTSEYYFVCELTEARFMRKQPHKTYHISPRFARLSLYAEIECGPQPVFWGRVSKNKDWFENCKVDFKGDLIGITIDITVDGVKSTY